MVFLIVPAVAMGASMLTFFSGFGLGTLLLPAFAIFFPIDVSIAMTAAVHFLNNVFKLFLVGRFTNRSILLRFGLPAIVAAFIGAQILISLGEIHAHRDFSAGGIPISLSVERVVIAILMMLFAAFEWSRALDRIQIDTRWLPVGGVLSGFFGGLSGHQGALRSAFMLRCNLSKEAFIATGVAIACLIDITRISLYLNHLVSEDMQSNFPLMALATLAAFVGAYLGNRLLTKMTMRSLQKGVAAMLFLIATAIALGWI